MNLTRTALVVIAATAGAIWALAFARRPNHPTIWQRLDRLAVRCGIFLPERRDTHWTKPTYADPFAGDDAPDPVEPLPDVHAGRVRCADQALAERHGWRVIGDSLKPGYLLVRRATDPKQASDSGKSGRVAQSEAKTSDHAAGAPEAPGGAPAADFTDGEFGYTHRYSGDGRVRHHLGTVTRDTMDPTAAEQREQFEAIKAKPRPNAVAIKAALEALNDASSALAKDGNERFVMELVAVASILDRLGVHCLALELKRDELAASLRKVAEQAKPIDGTDLAELVQEARLWAESNAQTERVYSRRRGAAIMGRLIGAVNDQARKLTAARTYTDDQWQAARNALFARYRDGDKPLVNVTTTTGEIVELVAKALGLERATD